MNHQQRYQAQLDAAPILGNVHLGKAASNQVAPSEPSITEQAAELLQHTRNLEREIAVLRGNLFGEDSLEADPSKQPQPHGVSLALNTIRERVATMVGDMAALNGKVAR